MNWYTKIKSKISKKDDSPELKKGEIKKILLTEIEKEIPNFKYLRYHNSCYTFQRETKRKGYTLYQNLHIIFSLKNRNFSCSIASRLDTNYINSSSFNMGLINPHIDLLVLKKGTGVIPVHEAFYFHNGRVKTTTEVVRQIIKDYSKYGLPFLDSHISILENNQILKTGLNFISKINIDKVSLKSQLEKELVSGSNLISSFKNPIYIELKTSLQNLKNQDRETRKNIPSLSYELLELYCNIEQ